MKYSKSAIKNAYDDELIMATIALTHIIFHARHFHSTSMYIQEDNSRYGCTANLYTCFDPFRCFSMTIPFGIFYCIFASPYSHHNESGKEYQNKSAKLTSFIYQWTKDSLYLKFFRSMNTDKQVNKSRENISLDCIYKWLQ